MVQRITGASAVVSVVEWSAVFPNACRGHQLMLRSEGRAANGAGGDAPSTLSYLATLSRLFPTALAMARQIYTDYLYQCTVRGKRSCTSTTWPTRTVYSGRGVEQICLRGSTREWSTWCGRVLNTSIRKWNTEHWAHALHAQNAVAASCSRPGREQMLPL